MAPHSDLGRPIERALSTGLWRLASGLIALVAALAGWWAFGWTAREHPDLGFIEESRWFGRVVRTTVDVDGDGRLDGEARVPWSSSVAGEVCWVLPGCTMWLREDRDGDGRWDTWWHRSEAAGGGLEISADLDGDGAADWFRRVDGPDVQEVLAALRAARGF
ncbi:MAG: hypothetical protein AAGN46_05840 [Acidobacteriota bacterium]